MRTKQSLDRAYYAGAKLPVLGKSDLDKNHDLI